MIYARSLFEYLDHRGCGIQCSGARQPIALPEIKIGGSPTPPAGNAASAGGVDRCVDVQIGSSRAFDCLNRKLREQADRVNPSMPAAPLELELAGSQGRYSQHSRRAAAIWQEFRGVGHAVSAAAANLQRADGQALNGLDFAEGALSSM